MAKRATTTAKLCQAFLSLLFILTLGSGCATLPNVSETISEAPTNGGSPQIVSTKGPLSFKQSKALMERLKRSVKTTDMLQRYVTVIESVSESPLTKGNRVTLLVNGPATYAAMFKAVESATDYLIEGLSLKVVQ